jgi:hypothetical protein
MPDEPLIPGAQPAITAPHAAVIPGQNAQPNAQPPVAPPPPVAPQIGSMHSPPDMISVPIAHLEALVATQARNHQLENEKREGERAAHEKLVQALAEKGQAVEAVKAVRDQMDVQLREATEKAVATSERIKRYALDNELRQVLGSKPLHEHAADQLTKLWKTEFMVAEEGDKYVVRTPTYQTVDQFVTAQLARPEYQHFVRASAAVGSGAIASGSVQGSPTGGPPPPEPEYKNAGEYYMAWTKQRQAQQNQNPNTNLQLPLGIRGLKPQ